MVTTILDALVSKGEPCEDGQNHDLRAFTVNSDPLVVGLRREGRGGRSRLGTESRNRKLRRLVMLGRWLETTGTTTPRECRNRWTRSDKPFSHCSRSAKADDIDGYLDLKDLETHVAADPRHRTLDQMREQKRSTLMEKRDIFQKIANAKIESVTVDTCKAEGLKTVLGFDLKGTVILVRTDGPDLFFHETENGWKLNSIHR